MSVTETTQDRAAPIRPNQGPVAWARANLFSTWYNALLTLLIAYVLARAIPGIIDWALVKASWTGDAAACREAGGACWAFLAEKWRFILFGTFPDDQHWRPTLAILSMIGTLVVSADRRFWGKALIYIWTVGIGFSALMMFGGVLGLDYVPTELWGGLPLTLALSIVGLVASFPLGVLLALGRTSDLPVMRGLSVVYIELVRGVPLISILFMASVMLPLFLPAGVSIDKVLRALIGICLFSAAYVAEVVRAGLQAIPKGQVEAAQALGLGYWQRQRLIILPQALSLVIPPLVNSFIASFKDTSLVIVIGLLDLLSTAKAALTDPAWRGFYKEAYLFVGVIYLLFCYALSRYSRYLETVLGQGRRR
ncbi:amino acid ABC transporter permease [Niveispirillum cyanobacteriorum]|uniref:Amino acid ABC transporter permease n=1 Tax=Niveispirillum cyanobacteriorum TaxID=1612173 RepID=A0A2K9NB65_9PROT|nr:amino acid ABC transporter permease [Niveispirillum cyanobacteriorum]AUN30393.1 amino acid ABC transporter permease [Niveispirillum cyanobacteriorum]GGE55004.1 amino acid ABC transporter permease [Niveispirillum cyanobacteriorum]